MAQYGQFPDTILVGTVEYELLHSIFCERTKTKKDITELKNLAGTRKILNMYIKQVNDLTYLRVVKGV